MKRKATTYNAPSKKQRIYQTPYQRPYTRSSTLPTRPSVEKKVNDVAVGTIQVHTTGSITLLCNPALGSDFNNRIGRKINITSCYIRGMVATEPSLGPATGTACPSQQARMILFEDMQPNGATPAVTDILNTASPFSQLNLNGRDRFKIYTDKIWSFGPYLASTTATQAQSLCAQQAYSIKKYKKLNIETIFNATNGGTIADITSGALFMLWIGSTASGGNDANAIISTRVRYNDI